VIYRDAGVGGLGDEVWVGRVQGSNVREEGGYSPEEWW